MNEKTKHPIATVPPKVREALEKTYNEALVKLQGGDLTGAVLHCRKGYRAAWLGGVEEAESFLRQRNRVLFNRGEG